MGKADVNVNLHALAALPRLLNTPLALELPCLRRYVEKPRASLVSAPDGSGAYALIDGVAVVPIADVLFHNAGWFGMSYDRIRASFDAAMADPEARAIALLVDSPGGEVAGCFDLAEDIYAARGGKPIVAVLDECAYSAAYALASAAEQIIVPRTGGTGSIGVVAMHVDLTAMLNDAGIKITVVQYGAQKTETSPVTPLSDDARARMQADVDVLGEMFVEMVARNRGMTTAAVRKTEAGVFMGSAGVDAGLADAVASPQEAFADLRKKIAGPSAIAKAQRSLGNSRIPVLFPGAKIPLCLANGDRPIKNLPRGKDDLFVEPDELTPEVQAMLDHNRDRFAKHFNYADSLGAGDYNTFDDEGNYNCGRCNQANKGDCLLINKKKLDLAAGSCRQWESIRSGDPEMLLQREDPTTASYGVAKNGAGFGCHRCPYSKPAKNTDDQGRKRWCGLGGFHQEPFACCELNGAETV